MKLEEFEWMLERQSNGFHTETYEIPPGVDDYEVFQWPEFRAFHKRLGIPVGCTTSSPLSLKEGEPVKIVHTMSGGNTSKKGIKVKF